VDLDGDGIPDVISGSWPGELYLFRGLRKGTFAAGETIKDRDGKAIKVGSASTVFAVDWNGRGKLDLLVGNRAGEVHLVPNERDGKKYAFGKARKLEADGKPIKVPQDSHPIAADWDGDGKLDLLVGAGDGSVLWYRNVGTTKEPKLAPAQTLVPAGAYGDEACKEDKCGILAKICVTDWSGGGRLDLLVGDFHVKVSEPLLTEKDKAALEEAERRDLKLRAENNSLVQQQKQLQKPPADETPAARAGREKKAKDLQNRSKKLLEEIAQVQQTLQQFPRTKHENVGNVWLFLRKPAKAGTKQP